MKKLIPFLVLIASPLLFAQGLTPNIDPDKFTVCAITINSDDEINTMKKYLDPKSFNPVVELTALPGSTKEDWFNKACESGIRCDQLVISGHFAGGFFGDGDKDLSLELDDLETASCSKKCDGIIKSPLEVFLLGCNTLALKDLDHRTPEQYLRVLINDGLSPADAQRIVEARYGATGPSNRTRMQTVFGDNKKIYGFTSTGPLGAEAKKYVNDYMTKTNPKEHLEMLSAKRMLNTMDYSNKTLIKSFAGRPMDECVGFDSENPFLKKICALKNPDLSVESKLLVVEEMLTADDYLMYLPAISLFARRNLDNPESLEPGAQEALSRLTKNAIVKNQIMGLADKMKNLGPAADLYTTLRNIHMISEDEHTAIIAKRAAAILKKPIPVADFSLCSEGVVLPNPKNYFPNLKITDVHPSNFTTAMGVYSLKCLGVTSNEAIIKKLTSTQTKNKDLKASIIMSVITSENSNNHYAMAYGAREYATMDNESREYFHFIVADSALDTPGLRKIAKDVVMKQADDTSGILRYFQGKTVSDKVLLDRVTKIMSDPKTSFYSRDVASTILRGNKASLDAASLKKLEEYLKEQEN